MMFYCRSLLFQNLFDAEFDLQTHPSKTGKNNITGRQSNLRFSENPVVQINTLAVHNYQLANNFYLDLIAKAV